MCRAKNPTNCAHDCLSNRNMEVNCTLIGYETWSQGKRIDEGHIPGPISNIICDFLYITCLTQEYLSFERILLILTSIKRFPNIRSTVMDKDKSVRSMLIKA